LESDGEFIMAVKYLSGNRIWGTDAERLAMTTDIPINTIFITSDTNVHYMYNPQSFDDKFVMRFKMTKVSFDGQTAFLGLSSTDDSNGIDTNQDFVGMAFRPATSTEIQGLATDNASPQDASRGSNANYTWSGSRYYEITRDGADLNYEVFSDSGYSTSLADNSMTMSGTINSLRYFKLSCAEFGQSGASDITFDDLELWASKTTASGTADYTYDTFDDVQITGSRITVSGEKVVWDVTSEYLINCLTIDINPSVWHEVA